MSEHNPWADWAREYVEEHGYHKAHRAVRGVEEELRLMAMRPRVDVDALAAREAALACERTLSPHALTFAAWVHSQDGVPRECFTVAPLDAATYARLRERFPDTPANLWAQWLDGDDCLGCPSGAANTGRYWCAVMNSTDDPATRRGAECAYVLTTNERMGQ